MEVSEMYFCDIAGTQNDHSTYVWYVLGIIYVFFTLFGYWIWGSGLARDWYNTC